MAEMHARDRDELGIETLDDLSPSELDALPFGVIQVNESGFVIQYSAAESRLSGRPAHAVIGRDFFRDVAPCTNLPAFRGRFLEGVRRGSLEEVFRFTFGFEPRPVRVEVHLRQAREANRFWIVVVPRGTVEPSRQRLAAEADDAVGRRARAEPVDPSVCEREPVHLVGTVQPHAAMLACDPAEASLPIQACSDNAGDALGVEGPGAVIGRSLADLLPPAVVEAVRAGRAEGALANPARPLRVKTRLVDDTPFLVVVHLHGGRLIVELERLPERPEDFNAPTPLAAADVVSDLREAEELAEAAAATARGIRALTGFERVLVYQFDPEWNGEAIAESKVADWDHSLLGLRFPASDIPAQARALYAKSPARFVIDRDAVPAPVLAEPRASNAAVDLSFAHSRSLSPIHLEYQRNLSVNGSMSLSLIVEKRLWGLVIGHHRRPHYLPPETRALAGLVADAFSLRVQELESKRLWLDHEQSLRVRNRLLERMAASDDFVSALTGHDGDGSATLLDLFGAKGAAIIGGERIATVGATPTEAELCDLAAWLRGHALAGHSSFATDELAAHYAPASGWRHVASGLLAARVEEVEAHPDSEHMLLWFRPEVASTVVWGGDPSEPVLTDSATRTVLPRRAFERWVEERRDRADPWAPWQVETAEAFAAGIAGIVLRQGRRISELTAEGRALAKALEQKDILAREVDHRVKNSLQIVAGVMLMQARGVADPAARAALEDTYARVMSVARVHDSLQSSEDLESVDLGETLRRLCSDLAAGVAGGERRLEMSADPGLMVASATAVALSLVATELVTNALKYAYAPGQPGHVAVTLRSRLAGGIELRVCDSGRGLPPDWAVRPATSGGGLGMRLISAMLNRIGASMEVDQSDGTGTCFMVLI